MCNEQIKQKNHSHEDYKKNNDMYLKGYQDQQTLFDKTLITLPSGAIFMIFTATKGRIDSWSLKFSIIAFILAVVSTAISFFCSAKQHQYYYVQYDKNYQNNQSCNELKSKWDRWVETTNNFSFICAIVGVLCLLWFFIQSPITPLCRVYEI